MFAFFIVLLFLFVEQIYINSFLYSRYFFVKMKIILSFVGFTMVSTYTFFLTLLEI